ncbi:unnamed protein product [Linum trigynum]|uniref:SWIM-type domain-containing protein n=1 Tax=Linum trigynum TaxID=586398 RepID=A0AAV2GN74_9ROSI
MFETIRKILMHRFRVRKETAVLKWKGRFCPKIQKKLDLAQKASFTCNAIQSGPQKFEVSCRQGQVVVDVSKSKCTCRMWELTGLPCPHAIRCIWQLSRRVEQYVDKCYEIGTYLAAYSSEVEPMVGPEYWLPSGKEPVLPP